MRYTLIFLFFILAIQTNAQKNKMDSLRKALAEANDTNKVITLVLMGRDHFNRDADSAIKYLDKAIKLGEDIEYIKGIKEAYSAYSIYYFIKNDYDNSIAAAKKIKDYKGASYTLVTDADADLLIANASMRKGLYDKAISYYLSSLTIYEKLKNEKRQSAVANNIGNIYYEQERYSEAIKYFERSIALKSKSSKEDELINVYSNLGNCYSAIHDSVKAMEIHQKNLEICLRSGNEINIASAYQNLGGAYYNFGNYKTALEYRLKSLNIFRNTDYTIETTSNYLGCSQTYAEMKDYKTALLYADSAKTLADETGFLFNRQLVYKNLAQFQKLMGNYKEALYYYEKAAALHDSLVDEENNKVITEMEAKYNSEKKDIEILVQKTEIEKQNTQRNGFIIGSILLSVLLIFILRSFYQKKKDNRIITAQKKEVEHQKALVDEQRKELVDSIHYAKRIQRALLPTEKYISKHIKK